MFVSRLASITESDSFNTIDIGEFYIILPPMNDERKQFYLDYYKAKPVKQGLKYNSGTNDKWMTVQDIRNAIKEHVDPSFQAL